MPKSEHEILLLAATLVQKFTLNTFQVVPDSIVYIFQKLMSQSVADEKLFLSNFLKLAMAIIQNCFFECFHFLKMQPSQTVYSEAEHLKAFLGCIIPAIGYDDSEIHQLGLD